VEKLTIIKIVFFVVVIVGVYLFTACVIWKKLRSSPYAWKVHISGPDDVHGPFFSEIKAHRLANDINKAWLKIRVKDGGDTPLHVATVLLADRRE
jgi:hypothetical protein